MIIIRRIDIIDMQESTGEKPQGAIRTPINEGDNKNQWEKELGGEAFLSQIEKGGRLLTIVAAEYFSEQATKYFQEEIATEIINPEE